MTDTDTGGTVRYHKAEYPKPGDAAEKLRRTMQAFPGLTLPEAIQFLGQLHDAGLDVRLIDGEAPT